MSSFYERVVFPWINDCSVGRSRELRELRVETLAPAHGAVLEIGFGTGLNLPHYPAGVTSITAVEPNEGMSERAKPRVARAPIPVNVIRGGAEGIASADGTFDTAVTTLTLCTVDDPARVCAELRRVLKPGGQLLLLEHGLAPDAGVRRWQRRLNPLQNVLACGCNLDRDLVQFVSDAGFRFETLRQFYVPHVPRPLGWITMGAARTDAQGRA